VHATGSRSFTQTLRKVAGKGSSRTQSLFKYFNQFIAAEPNDLEVLILDEAHRIRETSVDRYTPAKFRSGRAQIDELMPAARVPVFLLDEHQVVRPGELGTVDEIEAHAKKLGLAVRKISLDAQFRCGEAKPMSSGSASCWASLPADRCPGRVTARSACRSRRPRRKWNICSRPKSMPGTAPGWRPDSGRGVIPAPDGSLVPDVVIGDWSRPWNLRGDRAVGGAPPSALWATDPAGFGQVGCIYTAQGFEYDWNGVIVGPDLVWRDGRWAAVRDANKDPNLRSRTTVTNHEFERLVRNVYKVLLTRGMVGTIIYSTDPETRAMLRSLIVA
jgi:hypothetical protein